MNEQSLPGLAHRRLGDPEAAVRILFLHGLGSDGVTDWLGSPSARPGLARRMASSADVLVVDWLGHGASPSPGEVTTPSDQVSALKRTLDAVGFQPTSVVAHSMGSRLIWNVLGGSGLDVERAVISGLAAGEPLLAVDLAHLEARWGGNGSDPVPQTDDRTGAIAASLETGGSPARLLPVIRGLRAEPFRPDPLPGSIEILFLNGDDDRMAAREEPFAVLAPRSSFVDVPGAHATAKHTPRFAEEVTDFLLRPRD